MSAISPLDLPSPALPGGISGPPDAARLRRARWACRPQFAALGVTGGAWGVHIPSLKAQYGLDEASLSLVLFAAALGAVASLFFADRLIARIGARHAVLLAALLMAAMLALSLRRACAGAGWPACCPRCCCWAPPAACTTWPSTPRARRRKAWAGAP